MLLVRPAVGLLAWYAYSAVTRKALQRRVVDSMVLVAETRTPDGDWDALEATAAQLKAVMMVVPSPSVGDDASSRAATWVPVATKHKPTAGNPITFSVAVATSVATAAPPDLRGTAEIAYSAVQQTLYASPNKPVPTLTLRQCVAARDQRPRVVQDAVERVNWMKEVDTCLPLSPNDTKLLNQKV